jgi:hypothetical protein
MTTAQPLDPVIIEPVVNEEKLREVLALGAEYPTLDFKQELNLKDTRDKVELAKDIGAMSVVGGFIVVGVDSRGRPTGLVNRQQADYFDEARLRPMMLKWLPASLTLRSQDHEIDGKLVVLIFVAPNPAGCAFFASSGQYEEGKSSKTIFKAGDVYFRNGTQSSPMTQDGLEIVIHQRVARERNAWESDMATRFEESRQRRQSGDVGTAIANGPAVDFSLTLSRDDLVSSYVELLRKNDDIPIRLLFAEAPAYAHQQLTNPDQTALVGVIDRIASLAAISLELNRQAWFDSCVDVLVRIYGIPWDETPQIQDHPPTHYAQLWLSVIERIFGLGSLAVRNKNWNAVRCLALPRDERMHGIHKNWLRHALTMASRSGLLETYGDSDTVKMSLLSSAREVVRRMPHLRRDIGGDDDERILNGLVQFDFLGCLIAISENPDSDRMDFYPSFARFDETRAVPIVRKIISDDQMRSIIFPADNSSLASALKSIDRAARTEGFRFGGWDGYDDALIETFVDENAADLGTD